MPNQLAKTEKKNIFKLLVKAQNTQSGKGISQAQATNTAEYVVKTENIRLVISWNEIDLTSAEHKGKKKLGTWLSELR